MIVGIARATLGERVFRDDGPVYDTGKDFKTVNRVPAHGGSISVAEPVVVGETVYVLSGYNTFGEAPGNVLLAFTVDGH